MAQACELASSILNMSKADIDEMLDVDMYEVLSYLIVNIFYYRKNNLELIELSSINKVSLV